MHRLPFALLSLLFWALSAHAADPHWIRIAEANDADSGFRSSTQWDIDATSPKKESNPGVTVRIRTTINQDSSIPQLRTIIASERVVFDCVSGSYFVLEGTTMSSDHGTGTIVGPSPRSTSWVAADSNNPKANRLLNAVCTYLNLHNEH